MCLNGFLLCDYQPEKVAWISNPPEPIPKYQPAGVVCKLEVALL